jgi:hypothetical protein
MYAGLAGLNPKFNNHMLKLIGYCKKKSRKTTIDLGITVLFDCFRISQKQVPRITRSTISDVMFQGTITEIEGNMVTITNVVSLPDKIPYLDAIEFEWTKNTSTTHIENRKTKQDEIVMFNIRGGKVVNLLPEAFNNRYPMMIYLYELMQHDDQQESVKHFMKTRIKNNAFMDFICIENCILLNALMMLSIWSETALSVLSLVIQYYEVDRINSIDGETPNPTIISKFKKEHVSFIAYFGDSDIHDVQNFVLQIKGIFRLAHDNQNIAKQIFKHLVNYMRPFHTRLAKSLSKLHVIKMAKQNGGGNKEKIEDIV